MIPKFPDGWKVHWAWIPIAVAPDEAWCDEDLVYVTCRDLAIDVGYYRRAGEFRGLVIRDFDRVESWESPLEEFVTADPQAILSWAEATATRLL